MTSSLARRIAANIAKLPRTAAPAVAAAARPIRPCERSAKLIEFISCGRSIVFSR